MIGSFAQINFIRRPERRDMGHGATKSGSRICREWVKDIKKTDVPNAPRCRQPARLSQAQEILRQRDARIDPYLLH
jgi:hypothetical protein